MKHTLSLIVAIVGYASRLAEVADNGVVDNVENYTDRIFLCNLLEIRHLPRRVLLCASSV